MTKRLTKNQQASLRCYADCGRLDVPPRNQGQIVTVSYGCSPDYIYEHSLDQSDRTVTITAYQHPSHDCDFDPWNGEPETGRRVGVIYSGPASDQPDAKADE
jgi:hypothetical protein